jgi:hypothetical protein
VGLVLAAPLLLLGACEPLDDASMLDQRAIALVEQGRYD